MESVYENLKNHFRRKLSCFRLELLGFDLLKGVAVVLFTFLLFLFFYAGLLSFFRLLPDFKYVLYLILFLLLGVEFFFFLTSSLRTPKFFVKEFSYFLMPCHQHGLRINLLVQR